MVCWAARPVRPLVVPPSLAPLDPLQPKPLSVEALLPALELLLLRPPEPLLPEARLLMPESPVSPLRASAVRRKCQTLASRSDAARGVESCSRRGESRASGAEALDGANERSASSRPPESAGMEGMRGGSVPADQSEDGR